MFVPPQATRYITTRDADGLTIRIPSKLNVFAVGFLMVWLCGWALGEVSVAKIIFFMLPKQPAPFAFLIVWLCFWTFGGLGAMYQLLWQFSGREIIKTSSSAFGIKRELPGYSRTREYDLSQVRRLRVAPLFYRGVCRENLAFDYGSKTVRFGADVDEAEAGSILQTIIDYSPRLRHADTA